MEISTSSNIVTITGSIKTIRDFELIKNTMEEFKSLHKKIVIEIKDSISITSSIIGYLNKLVLKDNINLEVKVESDLLIELFDELNLRDTFNIKKI